MAKKFLESFDKDKNGVLNFEEFAIVIIFKNL